MLGHAIWKNRFAGDPKIDQTLRANGITYTIVGVMPEHYAFPDDGAIWMPLQLDPATLKRGEGQHVQVIGKLKAGVSIDAANADVNAILRRIASESREQREGVTGSVQDFVAGQIGPQPRQLLYRILGAVFFVLLIACANVANLLLDRAAHRSKEVGIRRLGVSRAAVVRQFLVEAMVLAAAGTVFGVAVAYLGIRDVPSSIPSRRSGSRSACIRQCCSSTSGRRS